MIFLLLNSKLFFNGVLYIFYIIGRTYILFFIILYYFYITFVKYKDMTFYNILISFIIVTQDMLCSAKLNIQAFKWTLHEA